MIDFLSLLYGAELLRLAAGVDILADSPSGWQVKVAEELENFRRDDGGYAKTDAGHSSSTYHTFLVVLAHQLLGRDTPDPQRIVEFVRSRARVDGGFVEIGAMKRSGTNPTAAAAGLLRIFDALDETTGDETAEFVADMQTDEGGLRANTRIPIADTLSTFTGLLTLADLGRLEWIDRQATIEYIHGVELPGGGFRGAVWDPATDVEYTFYGLGSLALLSA
jgi:geranylgeranyl transferase type-2 subunit beta